MKGGILTTAYLASCDVPRIATWFPKYPASKAAARSCHWREMGNLSFPFPVDGLVA